MRRLLYALLLGSGLAGAVPATDLKLNQPVIDTVQMLTAPQREALGQKLRGWQREGLMQGAVVIVDDFDGASSFDYAMAIFQRWQLGDKDKDNGLLLVIGRDNRQFRLITGRGLEGALPDVAVRKLLQGQLVPNFRQQRYAEGIEAVLAGAVGRLRARPVPATGRRRCPCWRPWPSPPYWRPSSAAVPAPAWAPGLVCWPGRPAAPKAAWLSVRC